MLSPVFHFFLSLINIHTLLSVTNIVTLHFEQANSLPSALTKVPVWGCTKSGVNVTEDSGGLDVDRMDVSHSLHIDTVLQQQLFNLLSLCKNWHYKRTEKV